MGGKTVVPELKTELPSGQSGTSGTTRPRASRKNTPSVPNY